MALSITNLFKKDSATSEQEQKIPATSGEGVQQFTPTQAKAAEAVEPKAKKHGEDGVCCGSCS